jgi:hypothetical protein
MTINKIKNERAEVPTNTKESQGIKREYFGYLYSNKLENLGEMDTFLST